MKQKIAIVAFSWGMRKFKEPNPCNLRIAEEVARLKRKYEKDFEILIFSQWEVGIGLRRIGISEEINAEVYDDKHDIYGNKLFLDSNLVWEELLPKLAEVDYILPVCQPFLHKNKIMSLIKKAKREGSINGEIVKESIKWIGFDKENDQWQCRTWWQALIYAILQVFSNKRPKWLKE